MCYSKRIEKVDCRITIQFTDELSYDLKLKQSGDMNKILNYITHIDIVEEFSGYSSFPRGVVSSNQLTLELNSVDKKLMPNCKESEYYGYMNENAIIKITLIVEDEEVLFNDFYVTSWYTDISSDNRYRVIIEANDIITKVLNCKVPNIAITEKVKFKDYFIAVIREFNRLNDSRHQIKLNPEFINFGKYTEMQFINLDTSNMSNMMNTISQCTLTNIYIDRDNFLKTNDCVAVSEEESIAVLSDCEQVKHIQENQDTFYNYSGVEVTFINNTVNEMSLLGSISDYKISAGENNINTLQVSNIYKINNIRIRPSSKTAEIEIKDIKYSNSNLEIFLVSSEETNVNIEVYGQDVKSCEYVQKQSRANKTGSNKLAVTNRLVVGAEASQYVEDLLFVIDVDNPSITVEGWIDPRIKLGKVTYVESKSTEFKGYYQTNRLHWSIGTGFNCQTDLLRLNREVE